MRGNEKVIAALNAALKEELMAINQYMVHAEMCENWGYKKLATTLKKQSIDEMKHAEALIERLLFLDGAPRMADPMELSIGSNVPGQMENDLRAELGAVALYNQSMRIAVDADDNGTRDLFLKLLKDEERHADWLEMQLGQIKELGLQTYLVEQL
jgi:bacterioferritin